MTVYLFHCTNGTGFPGTAGTTIHVRYDFAANQWTGGADFLAADSGMVGFDRDKLELTTQGGQPVADLLLRSTSDGFDDIPVNTYISRMVIHAPRQGVNPSGWRWMLFSRMF